MDSDLVSPGILMLHILPMSQYIDEEIFSGSTFSGVALFNWFTKSSKFGEGFDNNELLWSLSKSFHSMLQSIVVQQARKLLLLPMKLKEKMLQHSMQYQGSSQFCWYL